MLKIILKIYILNKMNIKNIFILALLVVILIIIVSLYKKIIKHIIYVYKKIMRNNIDYEIEKYENIFTYLKKYEEDDIYQPDEITCYDNNLLVESTIGLGKSCKTLNETVLDVNFKPLDEENEFNIRNEKDTTGQVSYDENKNPIFKVNKKYYSFKEVCPETVNNESAILCQNRKYNKVNKLNDKMKSIINEINDIQNEKLNKMNLNLKIHKNDNNRLFNRNITKNYLKYDSNIGFNKKYYGNELDILNNINIYNNYIKNKNT
jgi:hypothetical protein